METMVVTVAVVAPSIKATKATGSAGAEARKQPQGTCQRESLCSDHTILALLFVVELTAHPSPGLQLSVRR